MVTKHGISRAAERAGLNVKSAKRMFDVAMIRGHFENDFSKREREYMQKKSGFGFIAVYYSGYIFIITETGIGITMYQAPRWFGKKGRYDGKEEIRNMKRYSKFVHSKTDEEFMYASIC